MLKHYYHLFIQWIVDVLQRFVLSILAAGPIPRHIAFVMDGNRRYARSRGLEVKEGHSDGFTTLRAVLQICYRLGITCVTVYAFAIENFKRQPQEVESLMSLARNKLLELSEHGNLLSEYGVRLNVIGRTELLPTDLQEVIASIEKLTAQNKRATLNICMPYSSHDEMTRAVEKTVNRVLNGELTVDEVTVQDIDDALYTSERNLPPVDILIRTSGVRRLSNFLLWQVSENTQISFVKTYWPDFSLRDFIPIILDYQRDQWTTTPQPKVVT